MDRWGNSVFINNAVNTHALERIAKMLAVAAYGDIAVAKTPLLAEEMKKRGYKHNSPLNIKLATGEEVQCEYVDSIEDRVKTRVFGELLWLPS